MDKNPNNVKTWRELVGFITEQLPEDRWDDNIAVEVDGEVYSGNTDDVILDVTSDEYGILDVGHLVLVLDCNNNVRHV